MYNLNREPELLLTASGVVNMLGGSLCIYFFIITIS